MRERPRKSGNFMPIDYVHKEKLFFGSVLDLSESGIKIQNSPPLDEGAETTMTFLENYRFGPVKMHGRVVRSWPNGFAVRFIDSDPHNEFIIASYVATA